MFNFKKILIIILILSVYLSSFMVFGIVNSNFGTLEVNRVEINSFVTISAFLYKPSEASKIDRVPAIVLSHGISGSKEMMNSIALELAKNGFIAISMDLLGHGDSGGIFENQDTDPTLGMKDVVDYVSELDFVDSSKIGLIGHSLGAGAVRATSLVCGNVRACVFIAGGLGDIANDTDNYGVLNSTFPANLLIAVGSYDVLFDLDETRQELMPLFGCPLSIEENRVYGSFLDNNARSLFVSETIHLFEPVDGEIVSKIVYWMGNSLKTDTAFQEIQQSFTTGQLAVIVGLFAFVLLIFPISVIIINYFSFPKSTDEKREFLSNWKLFWVWGILGLALFLPLFSLGSLIPFPPLVFGSSFSWWLFGVGVVGLFVGKKWLFKNKSVEIKSIFSKSLTRSNIVFGGGIFLGLYLLLFVTQTIFLTDLRVATIPVFKTLFYPMRFVALLFFVPFYIVYFFVEGIFLCKLRKKDSNIILDFLKAVGIRVVPYLVLIFLNYLPMLILGIKVFPGFVGFIVEFILAMIPLFTLTVIYSWFFYQKTNNIGVGMVFNALIFAWVSAAIFPISF
jgi:dienelactone hydrolase